MTIHYNNEDQKSFRRKLRKEQTFTEKIIWRYLKDRNFLDCKFRRQYSIDRYVIDFYCPELKLAVEIDGDVHDLKDVKEKDGNRENYLKAFGITFVRIKNDEFLGNAEKAFKKIGDKIVELKNLTQPDKSGFPSP